MKPVKFLSILTVMALAAGCSNDETAEMNKGNAIGFNVVVGTPTRTEGLKTTNNITRFVVSAVTGGRLYMDQALLSKSNDVWEYKTENPNGTIIGDAGISYWPAAPVDFYAYYPSKGISSQMQEEGSAVTLTPEKQTIRYNVTGGDEDLLYAANIGETKDKHTTAPVEVNFRHALSQIVFKARLTPDSPIDVDIKQIRVRYVQNKGTLTWPTVTTAPNLEEDNGCDTENDDTWGKWTLEGGQGYYQLFWDSKEKITELNESSPESGPIGRTLFLLPQRLDPWLVSDGKGGVKVNNSTGAMLWIKCRIYDRKTHELLWPKKDKYGRLDGDLDGYKYLAVSLDNPKNDPKREPDASGKDPKHDRWMQGKKYTYTLIFGEGGGYNPKPDPEDPDNPKPVLVPIDFEVTVDVFQDGNNIDLNANNPANP